MHLNQLEALANLRSILSLANPTFALMLNLMDDLRVSIFL